MALFHIWVLRIDYLLHIVFLLSVLLHVVLSELLVIHFAAIYWFLLTNELLVFQIGEKLVLVDGPSHCCLGVLRFCGKSSRGAVHFRPADLARFKGKLLFHHWQFVVTCQLQVLDDTELLILAVVAELPLLVVLDLVLQPLSEANAIILRHISA